MPSYVDANLMSGETVLHRAKLHWWIFVKPAIVAVLGLIIGGITMGQGGPWVGVGLLVIILCCVPLILAVLTYLTTEFAVTSRRVVAKRGLFIRRTLELNHNRVEGLNVKQGMLGRLVNAGSLTVSGTGGTRQAIPSISGPMDFRRNALEIIDASN